MQWPHSIPLHDVKGVCTTGEADISGLCLASNSRHAACNFGICYERMQNNALKTQQEIASAQVQDCCMSACGWAGVGVRGWVGGEC